MNSLFPEFVEPSPLKKAELGYTGGDATDCEYLTPPELIKSLGEFALDPCAPVDRPWDTAKYHLTKTDDGLRAGWFGRIWLNPPYGAETGKWLRKLARHGHGVALVFARTETIALQDYVLGEAAAILFVKGRIKFFQNTGKKTRFTAPVPSCLVAYGSSNIPALYTSKIPGKIVILKS